MTVNVTLDCRNTRTDGGGYTNVEASNGQIYSYKYSGGSDGNGNVEVVKGTPTEIQVTIQADSRYHVDDTIVTNDPNRDITVTKADLTATFTDNAEDVEAGIEYSIKVKDTVANATFIADPKIDNIDR